MRRRLTSIHRGYRMALALLAWVPLVAVAAQDIGALGHIAPRNKVLYLSGTPGVRVTAIEVTPHQQVKAGAVLMAFSSYPQLLAEQELAQLQLKRAQELGPSNVQVEELALEAAKRQLSRAEAELASYRKLDAAARAEKELARRRQAVEDARNNSEAEALKLEQVRQETAIAEQEATQHLALADAQLRSGQLVAPSDGTVLEIRKAVGETLGNEPALLFADLSAMYVACEVYEGDLLRVRPGMKATVSSNSLPQDLTGIVERVDPLVQTDSRLGKVLIKLDSTRWAEQLIGMEVHVVIHI